MTRIPRVGVLLAAALVGTACNSGSNAVAQTSATPRPPASTTPSPSGPCARATGPGTPSGGDVLVPGDIPDNQAYVVYQATTDGYHLSVPEGWARTAATGVVTFSDKFNSIRVQTSPAPSAPSRASAQSTDMTGLAASVSCFQAGKVSLVTRKAGPAVLVNYRADSPADPVTGKVVRQDVERYEFWQAGRLAVITLASAQGSDNVDPWRKVTDSFAWGR